MEPAVGNHLYYQQQQLFQPSYLGTLENGHQQQQENGGGEIQMLNEIKENAKSPIIDFLRDILALPAVYGHICSFVGPREFRIHDPKTFTQMLNVAKSLPNHKEKSYLQISRALKSFEERKIGDFVMMRKVPNKRNQYKFYPENQMALGLSLLQIAISNIVYLVDVLWLDEKLKIPEAVWMNFFEALFCTEGVQKLGYDFQNDIRVIKSTFPFVTKILPLAKEVICMYKLLQQVVLIPDASRVVFGPRPPRNMGLSDMAYYFLKIKLPKNEREGNWSQRPLRLEQKKYAALDAHCLVKIYGIIEPKIKTLKPEQQMALRKCAIINFVVDEVKPSLAPCILADGQVGGKNKETDDDFVMNIQKASADLWSQASSSGKLIRSINDVRFVVDSMLFGLGKNLRKCGFDTQLIGDRNKIVEFCQQQNNEDYIVLSTGKGHTRLESILGAIRCFHVPVSTHTGAIQPSLIVKHIMRELNIAVRPENMGCRCVECNQRVFVPMPSQIVQVIFFMNAVRINAEWLDITEEDLQNSFKKLRDDSQLTLGITQPRQDRHQLAEGAYYLYEDSNHLECKTSHFSVDIINKLMFSGNRGASCSIDVGLKYTKDIFDNHQKQFVVCTECGKVQLSSTTYHDHEE